MNLIKRVKKIEDQLKEKFAKNGIVTIVTRTQEEFEEKKREYLRNNQKPEVFIWIKKFTDQPIPVD